MLLHRIARSLKQFCCHVRIISVQHGTIVCLSQLHHLLLLLLLPPGEVAAEVERCSRYVVKLAGRLDSTIQVRPGMRVPEMFSDLLPLRQRRRRRTYGSKYSRLGFLLCACMLVRPALLSGGCS